MVKKYIFMMLLCVAVFPVLSMNRLGLMREDRGAFVHGVHIRSQHMDEEGIVPNSDLITLDSEYEGCDSVCVERSFFYGLAYTAVLTQHGPQLASFLCALI